MLCLLQFVFYVFSLGHQFYQLLYSVLTRVIAVILVEGGNIATTGLTVVRQSYSNHNQ